MVIFLLVHDLTFLELAKEGDCLKNISFSIIMKASDLAGIELRTLGLPLDSLLTAQLGPLKSLYKYSYINNIISCSQICNMGLKISKQNTAII